MIAGCTLLNSIGLTAYQDDKIEIYTNAIVNKQKTIGDILLKRIDLDFTDEIIDLISLLEILDIGFSMKGADYLSYKRIVEILVLTYINDNFRKAINAIQYKYSTILELSEFLSRLNIKNTCIDIYQVI